MDRMCDPKVKTQVIFTMNLCVAQLFKVLYRRFSTGAAFGRSRGGHALSSAPPIENRRYGRMQSCATSEAFASPTPSAPAVRPA
jgi:hypothetical protein